MSKVHTRLFVTVGSTEFTDLLKAVTDIPFFDSMRKKGVSHVTIQVGESDLPALLQGRAEGEAFVAHGVEVEYFRFRPDIKSEFDRATYVVCHCGAGSLMEALASRCVTLAVANPALMGDHQNELADELGASQNIVSTTCRGLRAALEEVDAVAIVPLDQPRSDLINEILGDLTGV